MKTALHLLREVAAFVLFLAFLCVIFPAESLRDQAKEND